MRASAYDLHRLDAVRHQLLRSLDAALYQCGDRALPPFLSSRVFPNAPNQVEVPKKWQVLTDATIDPAALAESLPHQDESARERIAACYPGATTWQRVCAEFDLDYADLPDTTDEISPASSRRDTELADMSETSRGQEGEEAEADDEA